MVWEAEVLCGGRSRGRISLEVSLGVEKDSLVGYCIYIARVYWARWNLC